MEPKNYVNEWYKCYFLIDGKLKKEGNIQTHSNSWTLLFTLKYHNTNDNNMHLTVISFLFLLKKLPKKKVSIYYVALYSERKIN